MDFHSTRRAYATALVRAGASDRETMKLGGWSTPALITRYDEKDAIRAPPAAAVPVLVLSLPPEPARVAAPVVETRIEANFLRWPGSVGRSVSLSMPKAGSRRVLAAARPKTTRDPGIAIGPGAGKLTAFKPGKQALVKQAELVALVEAVRRQKSAPRGPARTAG